MTTQKTVIDTSSLKKMIGNTNKKTFKIGKKIVGEGHPVFIIAEIGINFDGDKEKTFKMIDAVSRAGCDAVKFQVFRHNTMYADKAGELVTANGAKVAIDKLIQMSELPFEWLKDLKNYSSNKGMEFFASVFDEFTVDALAKVNACAYKVASYEVTHIPLIKYIAKKGKPVIFSIGGAEIGEIAEAVKAIQESGNEQVVLMHCVAHYGVPLNKLNLNVLKTLQLQFPKVVIGYSDHSADPTAAPVAAVALGAKVIEKHITLDRNAEGPDHSFALEPDELKLMVEAIRQTEKLISKGKLIEVDQAVLGSAKVETSDNEEYVRNFAYRMIYVTAPIKKGGQLTRRNIAILRSGDNFKKLSSRAIAPKYYDLLIQKRRKVCINRDLLPGQAITWEDIIKYTV